MVDAQLVIRAIRQDASGAIRRVFLTIFMAPYELASSGGISSLVETIFTNSTQLLRIACGADGADAAVMDPWSAAYRAEMGLALIGRIARDILIAFMGRQLGSFLWIADERFRGG